MLFRGLLMGTEQSFPDAAPSNRSLVDVEEATLSHDSTRSSDGSESMSGQSGRRAGRRWRYLFGSRRTGNMLE